MALVYIGDVRAAGVYIPVLGGLCISPYDMEGMLSRGRTRYIYTSPLYDLIVDFWITVTRQFP